jgi:penicillin-binding protein 2
LGKQIMMDTIERFRQAPTPAGPRVADAGTPEDPNPRLPGGRR